MKRKRFSFLSLCYAPNLYNKQSVSGSTVQHKHRSDTKSHLGAHSFPVLSVVAFWNWFGRPDVDLGGLAGG